MAKEKSLALRALLCHQVVLLFLRFDSFRDDELLQALSDLNNGFDKDRALRLTRDLVCEGLIDLEDIDRELAKITKA
jgi:hypothetical protein